VVRYFVFGHLAEGGGEVEFGPVALTLADEGRATYFEVFAPEDVDLALRRFEEIGAQTEPERSYARLCRSFNARDLEAVGDCYADDVEMIDRRAIGWEPLRGRAAVMEMFASSIETVPDVEARFEVLAGDDDKVAVRFGVYGHAADGGGEAEVVASVVMALRGDRQARAEIFSDDDEALRRYEELRAGPAPSSDSATPRELALAYDRALQARDWSAVKATFTPDLRVIDHRLVGWGELNGADAYVEVLAGGVALIPDLSVRVEFLASGSRAWLARNWYRGHMAEGGGEAEIATLSLSRIRGTQVEHFELFDETDVDSALERFEEIGAETEPERNYARICRAVNARDLEAIGDCYDDSFELIDRRALGWETVRGGAAMAALFASWIEAVPDVEARFEALASDDETMAARWGGYGHAADGGGEMEYSMYAAVTMRGERQVRAELFDDEAAALARREELSARPASPRDVLDRFVSTYNARDWDGVREVFAPDMRFSDRRLIGWGDREGRDAFVELLAGLVELVSDVRIDARPLAVGSRAGLVRFLSRGHMATGGGEFEVAMVVLSLVDDGRTTYFEIFDEGDADAALARFEEIGAQTEAERLRARANRRWNARDWDALAACYAEGYELIDRRSLNWEPQRGAAAVVDLMRSWVDVAPDLEVWFEELAGDDHNLAIRFGGRGHAAAEAGGGPMEYDVVMVAAAPDGLMMREEMFAPGDESAALARYEELRREQRPGLDEQRPAQSLAALDDRLIAAYNARDWDAMRALLAPDLRVIDHRPVGWGELEGPEAFIRVLAGAVELAPDLHMESTRIAVGKCAYVSRISNRGHLAEGGGEVELALVPLSLVADGCYTRIETFSPDDAAAALARFEEIGAATEPERAYARLARTVNARDWNAMGRCVTDDYEFIDHRALGWEPTHGVVGATEMFRSWSEIVPDAELRFETLAGNDDHAVLISAGHGHAATEAGGGAMEYVNVILVTIREGRISRSQFFGIDRRDAALDLLAELIDGPAGAPAGTHDRADRPVGPRQLIDGYVATMNAHDWAGMDDVFAPDLRVVDRRLLGWGELEGRDSFVEVLKGTVESAPDMRVDEDVEVLALGRSAAVGRYLNRGHLADGGGDFEIPILSVAVVENGRTSYFEIFEFEDCDGALARFEEIGAQNEAERVYARICRAWNGRDWDALASCFADDLEYIERRRMGWEIPDRRAYLEMFRSWREMVADAELRFELLGGDDRHAVVRVGGHGVAAPEMGGGELEYTVVSLVTIRDHQIERVEQFGVGDEDAALARLEELLSAVASKDDWAAPRAVMDRYRCAYNERDWAGLAEVFAPDLRFIDRRPVGWGELTGRDAFVDILVGTVSLAPDLTVSSALLGGGRSASIVHAVSRGHLEQGGGEVEIGIVVLTRLNTAGQIAYFEVWDDADSAKAFERFEEIGAQTESERVYARLARTANARDWEAVADCFCEDFSTLEHRVLGWEPLHGPQEVIDVYRSWVEMAPDMQLRFEWLGGDEDHIALRWGGQGHAAAATGGGAFEYHLVIVATIRDGGISETEHFDVGDETAALARLGELTGE
jgi:ketosteroid isomerase-like protein